jgi:hypothetical protein
MRPKKKAYLFLVPYILLCVGSGFEMCRFTCQCLLSNVISLKVNSELEQAEEPKCEGGREEEEEEMLSPIYQLYALGQQTTCLV